MSINHIQNWAQSKDGQDIELYTSAHFLTSETQNKILFIGGMHGDEPAGVELAKNLLKWLQSTVEKKEHLKFTIEWALIPCINPDGYLKNQRTNANGVDLNRNFPSLSWTPQEEKNRYYPGSSAASEAETQALVELIQNVNLKTIIHFHSWKPCIVKTGEDPLEISLLLHAASGYNIVETIGYDTPGSLSQYAGIDRQITVICTEENDDEPIQSTWDRWGPGLKKIFYV